MFDFPAILTKFRLGGGGAVAGARTSDWGIVARTTRRASHCFYPPVTKLGRGEKFFKKTNEKSSLYYRLKGGWGCLQSLCYVLEL